MIRFVILACCCLIATRISSAKPAAPCVANFTVNIDALPLDLFQELLITVKVLRQMEYADVLTERKLSTFWYDRRKKVQHSARHAIERAIDHLEQYIQPIKSCTNIIGAEWWIQDKEVTAGIDFHYDKDEGLASLKRRMKHPSVSTVTYLTSEGAPTVILRQITPDGNRNIPAIPSFGYISFPVTNMHITYSGSLQHGVLRSASPFYDGKQEPELLSSSTVNVEGNHADITSPTNMIPPRRVTFLVNWYVCLLLCQYFLNRTVLLYILSFSTILFLRFSVLLLFLIGYRWSTRPLEPNSRVMSDAMALSLAQQVTDIQRLHRHHHNNQDERGNMLDKEINKLVENEQKDEGNMCQPLNNQQMGGQPYRNDDDKNYQCHDDETASFIPSIQPLARQQSMVTISNLHITKNNLSSLQQHKIVTPPEQLLFINLPMDLPATAYALAQSFIKRKSPLLLPNAPTMMDDLLIKHNQTNDSSDHDDSSVRSNHNS